MATDETNLIAPTVVRARKAWVYAMPSMVADSAQTDSGQKAHPLFSWRQAILRSDLRSTTKHLLLTISCHMSLCGKGAFPSTKLLAKEASLSERSVVTHIEISRAAGWLAVGPHGFGGKQWARHEYSIGWPSGTEGHSAPEKTDAIQNAEAGSAPGGVKVLNETREGAELDNRKALKQAQLSTSISSSNNSSNNSHMPSGAGVLELFVALWDVYPRKRGKVEALRIFSSLRPTPELTSEILGAVRGFVASDWRDREMKFVPYLSTFLRRKQWVDCWPEKEHAILEQTASRRWHGGRATRH